MFPVAANPPVAVLADGKQGVAVVKFRFVTLTAMLD
jgi:hypothetical protein